MFPISKAFHIHIQSEYKITIKEHQGLWANKSQSNEAMMTAHQHWYVNIHVPRRSVYIVRRRTYYCFKSEGHKSWFTRRTKNFKALIYNIRFESEKKLNSWVERAQKLAHCLIKSTRMMIALILIFKALKIDENSHRHGNVCFCWCWKKFLMSTARS